MTKTNKPPQLDISKVDDAIVVLKSRGDSHYRPDIMAYTGLSRGKVQAVLEFHERQAIANPTGKHRISVTRMKGTSGGIATTDREISIALNQREKSIDSQARHYEHQVEVEYKRHPGRRELAMDWAEAGRMVDIARFKQVRDEISVLYLDALLAQGMPTLDAVKAHLELMAEIDAL
jgi:hypothetical protein